MKKKILLALTFIMALGLMPVVGADVNVPQYNIVDEVCCTDAEEFEESFWNCPCNATRVEYVWGWVFSKNGYDFYQCDDGVWHVRIYRIYRWEIVSSRLICILCGTILAWR